MKAQEQLAPPGRNALAMTVRSPVRTVNPPSLFQCATMLCDDRLGKVTATNNLLRTMSAAAAILRASRNRKAGGFPPLELLGQAVAQPGRPGRSIADRWARPRGTWRKPHWTHVHRRPIGRLPLPGN